MFYFFRKDFIILAMFVFFAVINTPISHAEDQPQDAIDVLVLGDSLSAAYNLEQAQGWVILLQNMLHEKGVHINLINAAISGETTDGGVSRLPRLLNQHMPDIVYIELGGNDGLQGHSIKKLRDNLSTLITTSLDSGAKAILQSIQIPTNYGRRYNTMFTESFATVASEHNIALVPFFLEDIALQSELMMRDGIHPNAKGQQQIAEFMYQEFIPLIQTMDVSQ